MTKFNRKQTVRHQPAHKCSCCKKVGHNIKQCPNPAAKELIHLRAAVKGFLDGAPQKRFKGRLPVKKTAKSGLDITGKKQRRRMAPSRTQVEGELHIILPQVLLWMLIPHKLLQLLTSCFPLVLSVDLKKVALLVVRLLVKQNLSKHQGNCISGALLGNAKKDTMSLTFRCFAAHA